MVKIDHVHEEGDPRKRAIRLLSAKLTRICDDSSDLRNFSLLFIELVL